MSALSVVIPAATASSEYSAPRPMSISVSDLDDVRGRALHHGHVRAVLPQRAADVEGRVVRADDHAPLPAVGVRDRDAPRSGAGRRGRRPCPGTRAGWAGRTSRWPAPAASGGARRAGRPARLHRPLAGRLVVGRAGRLGVGPVVELHDLRVRLEPVGDLVLGGEHRPVVGELQVGHVVVPDRVVQAQRLVAAAPLVTGRLRLSTMIVGTRSWRSRAPRAMPAWPPPMISTYGCSVTPSSDASCSRPSSQVVRSGSRRARRPSGGSARAAFLVAP